MTSPANLAQKERQLNLLMALDKARDMPEGVDDPNTIFTTIMNELKATFTADACAIMLLAEADSSLESIVYTGTDREAALTQCRKAMHLSSPAAILPSEWSHTLGISITRSETNTVLGGIFLARKNTAFSEEDITLLTLAESQIDSAVIQARMVWKLANRNKELEAIYQIDRARDSNPTENDLINHFTVLLTENFQAELTLIFLSHMDTGEMLLRGVMDKGDMPPEMLAVLQGLTGTITIPQTIETPLGLDNLHLIAAPLVVSGMKLGAVVVGRKPSFATADHTLLFAMMTQMDSALVHSRVLQQLHQRNKELETIYRIDHIRDTESDMDTMLQRVLSELCVAVSSEIGYLMLFTETAERVLELKATTVEGVLTSPAYHEAIHRYSRQALDTGGPVYSNKPEGPVRSLVAIPLILNDQVIGVFGVINSRSPFGFSAEDRRVLQAITSQVDTAVFERLERRRMRQALSRSVDPKVIDHLLSRTNDNILAGEWVNLSVIFADLRGSTAWTERTEPEQLVRTLNRFLGTMTDVIFKHGGTLDKFVGDEVIGLFGTPAQMKDHALRAAQCAMDMQKAQKQLQEELQAEGLELPAMGVGISTGEVIAGEIGSPVRTDFTALGGAMNLGARLCGVAGPHQIYISSKTVEEAKEHLEVKALDTIDLKGLGDVTAYELLKVND